MKQHYSVLTYDYTDKSIYSNKNKFYNQNISLFNVGDYIQSLAAEQYLPYVSKYIDRDGFVYESVDTNIIMNGWYYIYDGNRFIPENFNALLLSIYIKNPESVPASFLNSIKRLQPIGCRDIATKNFFQSKGIDAYFSSCLTTTLGRTYKKDVDRKGIIFCDFPFYEFTENKNIKSNIKLFLSNFINRYESFSRYNKISSHVKQIIKHYPENIEYTRHMYSCNINHHDRFAIAKRLLNKYASAELVLTTRINCALPCLSLGTPVILLVPNYDKERYSGLSDFFNIIGFDNDGKFIYDVATYNNKVINKNTHIEKANQLECRCVDFIHKCMQE